MLIQFTRRDSKINQFLGCNWLPPEGARWGYFALLGLPAVPRKKIVYYIFIYRFINYAFLVGLASFFLCVLWTSTTPLGH